MKGNFSKSIILTAVGAVSALIALTYLGLVLGQPFSSSTADAKEFAKHVKPFNSVRWKQLVKEDSSSPERLWMIDDLLSRHHLVGMSRAHIDELLSVPPSSGYFKDYDYVYWLGPERGWGLDSEWLGLKFKDDCVAEARILRD